MQIIPCRDTRRKLDLLSVNLVFTVKQTKVTKQKFEKLPQ